MMLGKCLKMVQLAMRLLIFIILICTGAAHANNGNLNLPDAYTCVPDQCNSCEFNFVGVGFLKKTLNHMGCTELPCSSSFEIDALYEKCSRDWRYSKHIRYNDLSDAENNCVSGLRKFNYWESAYKRKEYGKNYAFYQCLDSNTRPFEKRHPKRASDICQQGWKDFMLSEEDITLKHAEQSTAYAYEQCNGYFDKNLNEYGFSENELNVLARYIALRQFPYVNGTGLDNLTKTTMVRGKNLRDIDILKNIFDVLKKDARINHHMVITPKMYDHFMEQYNSIKNR